MRLAVWGQMPARVLPGRRSLLQGLLLAPGHRGLLHLVLFQVLLRQVCTSLQPLCGQVKASWGCELLSFTSLPLRHYLTNTNLPLPKLMQSNCTNLDFQHPASAGRGVSAKQDYIHSKALRWSLPCHISRPSHSIKLLFCARETEASSWKAFQGQGIFS